LQLAQLIGLTIMENIIESAKSIPVSENYDVVVVGGGIAGLAAAVAAARNGVSVCLIEKEFGLGGLATLGNVSIYLPLCDGQGNQVIKGLGEELLKLSIRDGYYKIPDCWLPGGNVEERGRKRYQVDFNPMSYMLELEDFLAENNVRLYYDTRFCDVVRQSGLIKAVIVENKSGRSAIACGAVVDASGDADVCFRSGEETVSWNTNVCAGWFYYFDGATIRLEQFSKWHDAHGRHLSASGRGFAGDDAGDVTEFVLETRKLVRLKLIELKQENPKVIPLFMTSIPAFRMTRRLKGAVELEETDDKCYFDDTVGMTGSWRRSGPIFYVPLRALAAVRTGNLITAGRCISAGTTAWDIIRAIPTCAVTGEAAGTAAAALKQEDKTAFAQLDIPRLQRQLREQKVIIDKKFAIIGSR
jgi:hypothetical protein